MIHHSLWNMNTKADRILIHEPGDRPPLLEDPHRCAYQERLGGRHATIQDYEFCVIILFFSVLPFVLFDIRLSEDPKPRGRASDVSTISTCFSLCYFILPTPPPMRTPGAARSTPRHHPRLWILCYYIVFFCFAICVTRYLPLRRHISRENAHRMYPRYPRVFLYVIIYCPLPHQSLWERLGVSLSCTCAAFSLLC